MSRCLFSRCTSHLRNTILDNSETRKVIVSLGANLGSAFGAAEQTVAKAIKRLQAIGKSNFKASSLYVTSPVDCPGDTPDFVNAIVVFDADSSMQAEELLAALQAIESEFGRARSNVKNAPRALDLDLIAFGTLVQDAPDLHLPHPRASSRRFVLEPLAELEPDLCLPGQTRTVAELMQTLCSTQVAYRIDFPSLGH